MTTVIISIDDLQSVCEDWVDILLFADDAKLLEHHCMVVL